MLNQSSLLIEALTLSQLPTSLQLKQTLRTLQKLCQVQVKQAFGDIQKLAELTVKQAKQEMKTFEVQSKQGVKNVQISSASRLTQAIKKLQTLSSIKLRQSARSVLQNIPAGQMKQTLKSLQRIPSSNLSTVEFRQHLRLYSQRNLIIYKQQKPITGDPVSSCYIHDQRQGEWYANQLTHDLIRLQPLTGAIVQRKPNDESAKLPQPLHGLLTLLYQKLSAYIDRHYAQQQSAATCHFTINNNTTIDSIAIGLTSKLNNTHNYYTAQIISYWQFYTSTYSADITIANHFYENGNLIMKRQLPIKSQSYVQNQQLDLANLDEKQIDKIITIIAKEEKHSQKELQKLYTNKSTEALKKLRRQNPFTQTKMVWNLNAVRMNEEINIQLPKIII